MAVVSSNETAPNETHHYGDTLQVDCLAGFVFADHSSSMTITCSLDNTNGDMVTWLPDNEKALCERKKLPISAT